MRRFSENNSRFFLPSILDTFFVIIILYTVFIDTGKHILKDADVGYHVMTGRFILDNWQFPQVDFYSFTCAGKKWVAFSWGNDVIFALMDKIAQLNGVVILSTVLILATLLIVYRLLLYWKVNFFVLFFSLAAVTCLTSVHWLARPHLFTLFFTALIFYLLELSKDNSKYYYPIPVIMLLWANIHPGFVAGFFLLGIYIIGNALELVLHYSPDLQNLLQRVKSLSVVTFISLACSLITPYGINLYSYIYSTLTSYWIVNVTQEYLSPNFHHTLAVIVYGLIIVLIVLVSFNKPKKVLDLPQILAILFWLHLSLFSVRNIPLFAVIAIPCFALILQANIGQINYNYFQELSTRLMATEKSLNLHVWPITLILITVVIALNKGYVDKTQVLNCYFSEKEIPVQALKYFEANPVSGNLFNQDNWGGYIIYAYPQIKVFMDGRLDMYQQEFLDEYQKVVSISPEWQHILQKYNVKWILIENNTEFHNLLTNSPEWQTYYKDSLASIFVHKGS